MIVRVNLSEYLGQGDGQRPTIDQVVGHFDDKEYIKNADEIGGVPASLAKVPFKPVGNLSVKNRLRDRFSVKSRLGFLRDEF